MSAYPSRQRAKGLICKEEGCQRPAAAKLMCSVHYHADYGRRYYSADYTPRPRFDKSQPCAVLGCGKPHIKRGLCEFHYGRKRKYGDPLRVPPCRRVDRIIPPEMGATDLARTLGVSRARADQILNPDPKTSRVLVANALKSGRLVKPSHCQRCRAKTTPAKLQGHHWSYHPDAALDVQWLCQKCHTIVHTYIRRLKRAEEENVK